MNEYIYNHIPPMAKIMKLAQLEDAHLVYLLLKKKRKLITDQMQNTFYLIAEHSGFI